MLLEKFVPVVNSTIENHAFGAAEIVMAVTDASNSKNMCIYIDNGLYSNRLSIDSATFTGEELLKSIDFKGLKLCFDDFEYGNHSKWCCPFWLILELKGEYPEHYCKDLPLEIQQMVDELREKLI